KDPSALNALLFSALALSSGRARAMLAGAVDEWNFFYAMGFDRVGALRGERRASGIVPGRGAFVMLLGHEASAPAPRGPPPAPARRRLPPAALAVAPPRGRRPRALRVRPGSARARPRDPRGARGRGDLPRRRRPLVALARRRARDGPRGGRGHARDLRRPAS